MDWPLVLLLVFGSFIVLMAMGLPVAFCFLLVNLMGALLFWGGIPGLMQLGLVIGNSLITFSLVAVPLFILMGEVMFHSGLAPLMMGAVDKWLGRLPGRLGLLAVGSGTLFSTFTGTSLATTALMGEVLVPEMEKRGYRKSMSLGPVLGSGGLAMMIPPSALAVVLGALGNISIGQILIAIIIPGFLMAGLYTIYIVVRSYLQPSVAPPYDVGHISYRQRLATTARYILPLAFIIFLVTGVIFLGIATPSEAAATGALGTFILTAAYGRLNWTVVKRSVTGTIRVTAMIFMIIASAKAFGQILAFSGATTGLIQFVTGLPVSPFVILIAMQVVLLMLGALMEVVSIMMITVPIFMPVVNALGFDPVWFAVIYLLNMEMGTTSPPFGLSLFVMKGVAPKDTTMGDIYKAALPFLGCDVIAMMLIIFFPALALGLPALMWK